MSSTFGQSFRVHTWGDSHGKSIGAVIDGCPAGLPLSEADIQPYLNRRKPGQGLYTSQRSEADICQIHSGTFNGLTTGAPIMVLIENANPNSSDYDELADVYRPGHADYTYDMKYGFRDYRGGGRSSGRETAARVIGGAIAAKLLKQLEIEITAFTQSIGPVYAKSLNLEDCALNPLYMPDMQAAYLAADFIDELIAHKDSAGGIISCFVRGLPAGVGEPVADKLEAELAKALLSIGGFKGVEFGAGFASSRMSGSKNNDEFYIIKKGYDASYAENTVFKISKRSNNAGGVLGGISDGSALIINTAIKPTPSIGMTQKTIDKNGNEVVIEIGGRHDPVIVPRAVVVVEAMVAITILDLMLRGMAAKLDNIKKVYGKN